MAYETNAILWRMKIQVRRIKKNSFMAYEKTVFWRAKVNFMAYETKAILWRMKIQVNGV